MSFQDLDIAISYRSVGDGSFSDFLNRALPITKDYKRSVGFFSSSALGFIGDGVLALAKSGGHIHLATCPRLNDEDVIAIQTGYLDRERIRESVTNDVREALRVISDENAKVLYLLIRESILDVKIVIKNGGIYHDKLSLLEDYDGNVIACVGSANESEPGYHGNYEKVRIYKSWTDIDGRVEDETKEFTSIWEDSNENLIVMDFTEAIEREVIDRVDHKGAFGKPDNHYVMRDYQKEAKEKWIANGHKGFFVMATGTGKTITSINAFSDFVTTEKVFTVIAVPYKHLVAQWSEDVKAFLPNAYVVLVHGEEKEAETKIYTCYLASLKEYRPIIVITTIKSFCLEKYKKLYEKIAYEKLLIVDEAHNFYNLLSPELSEQYPYKLGLSATPVFGKDEHKTAELLEWFGGIVADYPIEKAIGKYLVNYEYHPIFVEATEKDEKKFVYYTQRMMLCLDSVTGTIIDSEAFTKAYRSRLKVISMAENKITKISSIFGEIKDTDHTIIYCSDGRMLYADGRNHQQEEVRHLEYVLRLINNSLLGKESNLKASKFTAAEDIGTRLDLINDFNNSKINYLVAIRCLDEGINIPSIKSALILSSNDNYREFVQRRGRILRLYTDPLTGKKKGKAHIYDVVVLPSADCKSFAEIELRRYFEYSRLALNKDELLSELDHLLSHYGLMKEDILFKNEYVYGGELDD